MTEAATPSTAPDVWAAPTLPALRESYLTTFYATLFYPVQAFRRIVADPEPGNRLLFHALMSVLLVSTTAPMAHMVMSGGRPSDLVMTIPFSAIVGVLAWGLMAMIVGLLSYAFTGKARIRSFLILSGLAALPWLLMGPVGLLKIGLGAVGLVLCAMLGMLVWLWTTLLFAFAIMTTYDMSAERVMIVLVMPFVMLLVCLGWLVGFIDNIRHLAPPF